MTLRGSTTPPALASEAARANLACASQLPRYVATQRHQAADFPNASQSNATFRQEFDFAGSTDASLDRAAVLVLDPVTDVIAARPLTSTGATTATVDLVLPAGGGVLLKYKNARPFARQ